MGFKKTSYSQHSNVTTEDIPAIKSQKLVLILIAVIFYYEKSYKLELSIRQSGLKISK